MKVVKIMFAALIFVGAFASCSEDEDGGQIDDLVGRWIANSVITSNCSDPEFNGTQECPNGCIDITIASNGTYTATGDIMDGMTETGTVTMTGATILLCATGEECPAEEAVPYTLSGNTLTVYFNEGGCDIIMEMTKQ